MGEGRGTVRRLRARLPGHRSERRPPRPEGRPALEEREDYTLRHIGYHKLAPGTIIEGEVTDPDLPAAEIKEFWSSHSFKGKSVVLGVSDQRVIVRLLNFSHIDKEDLRSAIEFEAQDHIPMPLEEAPRWGTAT